MIVQKDKDHNGISPGTSLPGGPNDLSPSQSHAPMATVPQSLCYLSPDLQERLVLASVNKLMVELRECLKVQSDRAEGIVLRICALNCSITAKCRNLQIWSIFHHNCKVRNSICFLTVNYVEDE